MCEAINSTDVSDNNEPEKFISMKEDFSKYNGEGTELRAAQMRLLKMLIEFDRICKKHDIEYFLSGGSCLGAVRHGGFIPWDDDLDVDVMYKDYPKLNQVLVEELPDTYFLQTPKSEKGYYHIFSRIVDLNSTMHYPEKYKARQHLSNHGLFLDIFPLQGGINLKVKREIDKRFVTLFRFSRGIGGTALKRLFSRAVWPISKLFVDFMNFVSSTVLIHFSDKENMTHIYGTNIVPKIRYSNVFPTKPIQFEGVWFRGPAKPHDYLTDLYGDYMKVPSPEKRVTHSVKIELF